MSTQDFAKQFQELILEESQKLIGADSVAAPIEMMGKMVDAIEAAVSQGVELPPEVLEHAVVLKTMLSEAQAIDSGTDFADSEAPTSKK